MEPFRIHIPNEVLDDLRARLRRTRWPDHPRIGWKQGTELDWLRSLVLYWSDKFDRRAWEQRLDALKQFMWDGIHFGKRHSTGSMGYPSPATTPLRSYRS